MGTTSCAGLAPTSRHRGASSPTRRSRSSGKRWTRGLRLARRRLLRVDAALRHPRPAGAERLDMDPGGKRRRTGPVPSLGLRRVEGRADNQGHCGEGGGGSRSLRGSLAHSISGALRSSPRPGGGHDHGAEERSFRRRAHARPRPGRHGVRDSRPAPDRGREAAHAARETMKKKQTSRPHSEMNGKESRRRRRSSTGR